MQQQQQQQQQQLYLLYGLEVRVVEMGNARPTAKTRAVPPVGGWSQVHSGGERHTTTTTTTTTTAVSPVWG